MANTVDILVKATDQASDQLQGIGQKMQGLGSSAMKVGGMLTAGLTLPLAGMAVVGIKAASDLGESMNKNQVTFGAASKSIQQFAETSGKSFGISKQKALEYSATLGVILQASGLAQDASADMSEELVKLAADLASFNNIPIDEALEKIRAGLVGEAEPLRTVGVLLSEAAVQTKAYQMGLAEQGAALTDAQKVQARYAIILDQTKTAQGDFARTSDGLANQQRILSATFSDTAAKLGTALLPIMVSLAPHMISLVEQAGKAAQFFSELPQPIQLAAVTFGALLAVLGPLVLMLGSVLTAFGQIMTAAPGMVRALQTLIRVTGPFGLYGSLLALGLVIGMNADKLVEWASKIPLVGDKLEDLAEAIGLVERASERQQEVYDALSRAQRDAEARVSGLKAAYSDTSVVLRKLIDEFQAGIPTWDENEEQMRALGEVIRQVAGDDLQLWLKATADMTEEQRKATLFTFGLADAYRVYQEEGAKAAEASAKAADSFKPVQLSAEETAEGIISAFQSIAPSMEDSLSEWDKKLTEVFQAHVNFEANITGIYTRLKEVGIENAREIAIGIAEQGPEAVAAWNRMLVEAPDETVRALGDLRPELETKVGEVATGIIDQLDQAARAAEIAHAIAEAYKLGLTIPLSDPDTLLASFNAGFALMEAAIEGSRAAAQIQSPSKVAQKIGFDYALGLAMGIEAGTPQVIAVAETLVNSVNDMIQRMLQAVAMGDPNAPALADIIRAQLPRPAAPGPSYTLTPYAVSQARQLIAAGSPNAPSQESVLAGIPRLAHGGKVTRPTLAVVGDAGPEAVVPLNQGGWGNSVININISAIDGASVRRIMPEIITELQRAQRGALA